MSRTTINGNDRNKKVGRSTIEKEVLLSVNHAGLTAKGIQRFSLAIRFAGDSWKKASGTEYVLPEIDWDINRLYFTTSNKNQGYKLTGDKSVRVITVTIYEPEKWKKFTGEYDLLKEIESGDYYIDLKEHGK